MPMSQAYRQRLFPHLNEIAAHFGTPFHLYDEAGIRETAATLTRAFAQVSGFREYFAVKALPNPHILAILRECGFGFDCSSVPELVLSRSIGARGEDIMFTSNNTTPAEFGIAQDDGGSILNLDDLTHLQHLTTVPDLISFRYNPGARRSGSAIIGMPTEAKFGVDHEHIITAYRLAHDMGVRRFGLHTMLVSNERDHTYMLQTSAMLLELAETIAAAVGITCEFINIGGGLGIPYTPDDAPLDLHALAQGIREQFDRFAQQHGTAPRLYMESGRYITGPHGVLVARVVNRKATYRTYIGVDADMSALMRPGMYGAYHHIDVVGKADVRETVDVTGALCENNDKFAVQRDLPRAEPGDLLVIHDTGAHGHAMGFNYNGRLRPQELLLGADGCVSRIRRAETIDDYLVTLHFAPEQLSLK